MNLITLHLLRHTYLVAGVKAGFCRNIVSSPCSLFISLKIKLYYWNYCLQFFISFLLTYFRFPDIIVMIAVSTPRKVLRKMRNWEVNSGFTGGTLFQTNSVKYRKMADSMTTKAVKSVAIFLRNGTG